MLNLSLMILTIAIGAEARPALDPGCRDVHACSRSNSLSQCFYDVTCDQNHLGCNADYGAAGGKYQGRCRYCSMTPGGPCAGRFTSCPMCPPLPPMDAAVPLLTTTTDADCYSYVAADNNPNNIPDPIVAGRVYHYFYDHHDPVNHRTSDIFAGPCTKALAAVALDTCTSLGKSCEASQCCDGLVCYEEARGPYGPKHKVCISPKAPSALALIAEVANCPEVMCMVHCEDGFLADENGCDTCNCGEAPKAAELAEVAKCPEVMCMVHCEIGFLADENGCDTCSCGPRSTSGDGTVETCEVCRTRQRAGENIACLQCAEVLTEVKGAGVWTYAEDFKCYETSKNYAALWATMEAVSVITGAPSSKIQKGPTCAGRGFAIKGEVPAPVRLLFVGVTMWQKVPKSALRGTAVATF